MRKDLPPHSNTHNRRAIPAIAAIAATALSIVGALSPAAAAFLPTPLDLDVLVTSDDFEKAFPGSNWTVADVDPANGTDTWGASGNRTYGGNGSVWSATVGSQTTDLVPLDEGFEGTPGANWTFQDTDTNNGADYWGTDSLFAHSGSKSLWLGAVGTQPNGTSNLISRRYDDNMDAYAFYSVDLRSYGTLTLEFYYLYDLESCCDFFYAGYDDGGWTWTLSGITGNNHLSTWNFVSMSVPSSATAVGFYVSTDGSVVYQGVYVDDVRLYGQRVDLNTVLRTYDTGMNATMVRGVAVDAYAAAHVDYRYWLAVDSGNDVLEAGYAVAGNWTWANRHNTSSSGWQIGTFTVPLNATLIGFRFSSNAVGHAEGAYLDDVKAWGTVRSLTCGAGVSARTGMEVISPFAYNGSASAGMRPYVWSWSFSDGSAAAIQNPVHLYPAVGSYNATLTVRDAVGQVCTAGTPSVTLDHDTTGASIIPLSSNVVEGGSLQLSGADGQGHLYPVDWQLDPPSCGVLSAGSGATTTFTASTQAGGSVCRVQGAIGPVSGNATLNILHDTSSITISPPGATVAEGKGLTLAAADRSGHPLDFSWSTTCGRLSADLGPATVFTAVTTGGTVCTVTAALGSDTTTSSVSVVHDTSDIVLTPASASLREGTDQAFSAVDIYSHPFDATWSVAPTACGLFTAATGTSTRFQASTDAGGLTCTVSAAFGADRKNVTVTVTHDIGTPSLAPTSVNAVEGTSSTFSVTDTFGHPLSVTWALGPATCGVSSTPVGPSTTVSTSVEAGGTSCTLTATGLGVNLGASISVLHGAPASVQVLLSAARADEGTSVTATAGVLDPANHTLTGLAVDWSSTCGALSSASGASKTLQLPDDAGASPFCIVSAAYAALSASATVTLRHAGPYTVAFEPPAPVVGGGGTQAFAAQVKDSHGHMIAGAPVRWTATCGGLSAPEGASVTYTAPGDLGGTNCRVSAEYIDAATQTTSPSASASVSVPMSALLPIGVILPLAAVGAAVFLMMKRRRAAKGLEAAEDGSTLPSDEGAAPGAPSGSAPAGAPGAGGSAGLAPAPSLLLPMGSTPAPPKSTVAKAPAKPPASVPTKTAAPSKPVTGAPAKRAAAVPAKIASTAPAKTSLPAKPPAALSGAVPTPPTSPAAAGATQQPPGPPVEAPCPKCAKPVEVGWAACPECGLDLVWN